MALEEQTKGRSIIWRTCVVQVLSSRGWGICNAVCDANAYVSVITCHRYIAWHVGEETRCQM
jgi:hypothetical protein